jgi:hypothetical protein
LATTNSLALANDIDCKTGSWPGNEDSLGKQLSSLMNVLKRKGVLIEPGRSDERFWMIHPYSRPWALPRVDTLLPLRGVL